METKILITQTHIYKITFQWDYQVWIHIGLHCFMEFGQIFQNDTETQEKKINRVKIQNISLGSIAPDPCRCLCIQHWLFQTSSPFILHPHLIITKFIFIVPFKVPHPNEEFSVQTETQRKNSNFTGLMISGSTYYA